MEELLVFFVGAAGYGLIEILWRGYTHWTMLVTGGICLLVLYKAFEMLRGGKLIIKCLLGGLIITTAELFIGMIVTVELGLDVWDYSEMPMNLYGQICLLYSFFWTLLCYPAVFLCRVIKRFVSRYS